MAGCYLVYTLQLRGDGTVKRSEDPVYITGYLHGTKDEKKLQVRRELQLSSTQDVYLVQCALDYKRSVEKIIEKARTKGQKLTTGQAMKIRFERSEKRRAKKFKQGGVI